MSREPERLSKSDSSAPPDGLPPRVSDPGMSDEAIRRGSGKSWDEWLAILDAWNAHAKTHAEIARHLATAHGVGDWWAQAVTVGYERARGLRVRHERASGHFDSSTTRTFPVPVATLYRAVVDASLRDRWLEPGTLSLRTATESKSARFDMPSDSSKVNINFWPKGDAKSSIQLQHEKLPTAGSVTNSKVFWKERLTRLPSLLETLA